MVPEMNKICFCKKMPKSIWWSVDSYKGAYKAKSFDHMALKNMARRLDTRYAIGLNLLLFAFNPHLPPQYIWIIAWQPWYEGEASSLSEKANRQCCFISLWSG